MYAEGTKCSLYVFLAIISTFLFLLEVCTNDSQLHIVCVPTYCVCAHSLKLFSRTLSISSGERPTLPELLRLRVPQSVGDDYSTFGTFLLNDETGSRMNTIEDTYSGKPTRITRQILQEWMEGKGLPLTWESLIQTLRDTGLSTLADEIAAKKL